jgi:hypothetical protein
MDTKLLSSVAQDTAIKMASLGVHQQENHHVLSLSRGQVGLRRAGHGGGDWPWQGTKKVQIDQWRARRDAHFRPQLSSFFEFFGAQNGTR